MWLQHKKLLHTELPAKKRADAYLPPPLFSASTINMIMKGTLLLARLIKKTTLGADARRYIKKKKNVYMHTLPVYEPDPREFNHRNGH